MNELDIKTVAIQGGKGAFHEIAALEYYKGEEIEICPCETFTDLVEAVRSGDTDCGLMAIENSVAGTLLPNYSLLPEYSLRIKGETYLRIQQNLIALPGQSIYDITEVRSHPIAIGQSREFFKSHRHIRLVESPDTALSAKEISEKGMYGTGAIASRRAAELYNLEAIAEGIETNKRNYTRFLEIVKNGDEDCLAYKDSINKSSLCFTLPHRKGSLAEILSVIAEYGNNLTKIQSLPIIGKEWEYMFYADMLFESYNEYLQTIEAIRPLTGELTLLGEYLKGKTNYENTTV